MTFDYINKRSAANENLGDINKVIDKMLKENVITNKPKAKGNSYFCYRYLYFW